jgi:peptidoglycan/xylan/chitin deacetylase (PgdA/CDA1 family)
MTRSSLLVRSAIVLVVAAFLLFGPVLVTVDGYPRWVARGTTVGGLVQHDGVRAFPGDLLDVRGGIIMPRAGGPQIIDVDGSIASSDTVLGHGSAVVSRRGPDTVEPIETVTVETTPPIRYRGHGPVESVEMSSKPGLARVVRGAVSGIELERRVILRAGPMTVRREPAWPGRRRVALTFDDGPWPGQTELFVAALQDAGARGTFFMVGYLTTRHPALAHVVADAGMEVGAHSQSHKPLKRASHAMIRSEISKGIASVTKVIGRRPVFYRPAAGSVNGFVYQEAKRLKVRVVMWTIDPKDWKKPGANVIARRILDRIRPGSVVLMHDGGGDRSQTLEALKIVLGGLAARGYETVTLSELYAKSPLR